MAEIFAERIDYTLAHLTLLLRHRNLRCDPDWSSILNGPLEDLQVMIEISSLCFTTMKQADQISERSLSTSSSGSGFIRASSVHHSIESKPFESADIFDFDTPVVTGRLHTGPTPSLTSPANTTTPLWDQLPDIDLSKLFPSPSTIMGEPISFPPPTTLPYWDTVNMLEHPPPPEMSPPYFNGFSDFVSLEPCLKGNDYGDLLLPQSFPNLQPLEMACYSNEIEQTPSHVSGPLSQQCDTREETSVLVPRDLFSNIELPNTFCTMILVEKNHRTSNRHEPHKGCT